MGPLHVQHSNGGRLALAIRHNCVEMKYVRPRKNDDNEPKLLPFRKTVRERLPHLHDTLNATVSINCTLKNSN